VERNEDRDVKMLVHTRDANRDFRRSRRLGRFDPVPEPVGYPDGLNSYGE
jgi:hypothetical protein